MEQEIFNPILRFIVMSDIHIKDDHTAERDRMIKGIEDAYAIAARHDTYKALDALVIDGDFANSGSETQFLAVKDILDTHIRKGTRVIASIASHEYNRDNGGVEAANEKLKRIMGMEPDTHQVINGFHFVSISPSSSCVYDDEKKAWMYQNLKEARDAAPAQPIFTFQHPHLSGTVYGSIFWGDDDLIGSMVDFPQIIDFSGHSHAPINDPRSIHQDRWTSLGTGTLSYFELDEFDKIYRTIPDNHKEAAQMLIVEADADNRVRVYPYDIITGNFFPFVWKIDNPAEPETFLYTDAKRYAAAQKPYFKDGCKAEATEITDKGATIVFPQACADDMPYVNSYYVTIRSKEDGRIKSVRSIWSGYYFYNMPETCSITFDNLRSNTEYTASVAAKGFFDNYSSNTLTVDFKTK